MSTLPNNLQHMIELAHHCCLCDRRKYPQEINLLLCPYCNITAFIDSFWQIKQNAVESKTYQGNKLPFLFVVNQIINLY